MKDLTPCLFKDMVKNRDEHREPVIRAFVALPRETLVEVVERRLLGSGLCVSPRDIINKSRRTYMRYEYKIVTPEMKGWIKKKVSADTVEELNILGREGWDLVGVAPVTANMGTSWGGTTASFVFFFKRPLT